ncbi:MAG TPA: tetratricopeptide repeat protein [Candidatus Eisenbacteria bacterium]
MRPGPMRARLALALALALAAPAASAQVPDSAASRPRMRLPQGMDPVFPRVVQALRDPARPLVLHFTVEPPISQHPFPPLAPAQAGRLRQAEADREAGLLDRARTTLTDLDREVPHHPLVLTERARLDLARGDDAAVERAARPERAQQRDSLLMATELITALERLGRPRDAAEIAVEAWAADPAQDWAGDSLMRLAPADPRGVREVLHAAVRRLPARVDLALVAIRIEWRAGDPKEALRMLAAADGPALRPPLRARFADGLLETPSARDSAGAAEILLELSADTRIGREFRLPAARRAWELFVALGGESGAAPRVLHALGDIPAEQWDGAFLMDVARALRRAGLTNEARTLLATGQRSVSRREVELEQALADLRDGPPERALPRLLAASTGSIEAQFRYAEALFFAGQPDSALACYQRVVRDPSSEFTGPAFERIYLIEDADPRSALPVFGRIAWEEWRGEPKRAAALTESLAVALPRGPLWAQVAIKLAAQRDAAGDARAALEPLLAIADSLPDDRLAPQARERAGDLYLNRLKDVRRAVDQYEACLTRYPRAWNAAEVRRKLESLRRDRRL